MNEEFKAWAIKMNNGQYYSSNPEHKIPAFWWNEPDVERGIGIGAFPEGSVAVLVNVSIEEL